MKGFSNFVRKHTGLCCVILAVLLVFSVIAGISLGPVNIPFRDVWRIIFNKLFGNGNIDDIKTGTQNIVWFIRIPRVLLGLAVGGGLTLSGVGMQAFTKNPLAEPYVLGISSGASAGAVLAIIASVVLPWGKMSISFGSFVGALLSIIIVYTLSRSGGDITPIRLVLVGVAVSAIFRALTNFIVYTAPSDAQVRQATFWMLGGLGSAEWSDLIITYAVLIPSAHFHHRRAYILCRCGQRLYRICGTYRSPHRPLGNGCGSFKGHTPFAPVRKHLHDMGGRCRKACLRPCGASCGNTYSAVRRPAFPVDGQKAQIRIRKVIICLQ